jgi:hypothetical protein
MIRNLKALAAAAMSLAVFGVAAVSTGQAAEFHCSVEPCRYTMKPDGTVGFKTAHHVFAINEGEGIVTVTCAKVEGEGTSSTKTAKELTITNLGGLLPCTLNGEAASVVLNSCGYLYSSAGELTIKCPFGKGMEFVGPGCRMVIAPQGPLPGIKYYDAGATKSELTVETSVQKLKGELIGSKAGCGGVEPGAFTEGEYKTGNAILTGETDNAEAKMANVWWE